MRCSWCGMDKADGEWEMVSGEPECIDKWQCETRVLSLGHGS